MIQKIQILDLGFCDYAKIWTYQKELVEQRVKGQIADTLIFVEHPPTITLGRRAGRHHLLLSLKDLENLCVGVYEVERGGDVTYHGPGQLVGYPIVHLKNGLRDVIPFVRSLEEILIQTLAHFGIDGFRTPGFTGVWTEKGKIASIGVAVKHNVTFHGFALNVCTDLSHFDWIVPCGIADVQMVSMEKILNRKVSLEDVKSAIVESLPDGTFSLSERGNEKKQKTEEALLLRRSA